MIDEQTAKILQAISELTRTEGWQHLKEDFSFQIEQLQDEINEPGGNEVKYSEGDLKKIKMSVMKEMISYPDKYVSLVSTEKQVENQDPFENK